MPRIAGPGTGLPAPQALYPVTLNNTAFTAPTNRLSLQAGQATLVPAGTWLISGGAPSAVQYLDPVTQQWTNLTVFGAPFIEMVQSDGFTSRVANLTGVATGATVSAAGSNYVQGTTVVNPSTGNSRWVAVVGGALATPTVGAAGANYGLPPVVSIAAPPPPGVAATATAALTAGAVSGITLTSVGAGYRSPPAIVLVPSSTDPNVGTIQNATATTTLTGAGTVTAVLLQNFGTQLAAAPTLAVAGAGSGATAVTVPVTGSWVAPASDTIIIQPAGFG